MCLFRTSWNPYFVLLQYGMWQLDFEFALVKHRLDFEYTLSKHTDLYTFCIELKNPESLCHSGVLKCIATGYMLDDQDSISGRVKIFFPLHSIQNGSGACPASYPISTGGGVISRGVRRLGREADRPPPPRMLELYLHPPLFLDGILIN
jgi:hypothetical protein